MESQYFPLNLWELQLNGSVMRHEQFICRCFWSSNNTYIVVVTLVADVSRDQELNLLTNYSMTKK